MKHHRLFWFLSLLLCVSLSCNLPGRDVLPTPGEMAEVTSISVTPPSGTGHFSAVVKGTTLADVESKLECYVSPDNEATKYTDDVSGNGNNGWSFTRDFTFTYTDPGTHTLVCLINNGSGTAWSEDFVVVSPPILTITASSGTMTYGGTVPIIIASYNGFVNGDTASSLKYAPTCGTLATKISPSSGFYPTMCSGADANGNYTISYEDGVMGVSPAPLIITASSATMTEGGTVPTITPSYFGFVNGDTASSMQTAPICSTTATSTSPVGSYPSSCSGAVYAVYPKYENYTISYLDGTVIVTPATPTTLTLNGTFKLPEGEGACANGSGQYHDSALAISGTLVLTVDYTTGQASVTLQGTNTATVTTCNYPTATETWTIKGVTLHGTINPSTNTLAIAGDVPIDVASSCQIIDETNGGACIAGSQTVNSKMTLKGSIDPAHSKGSGQITYTGYTNWGVWQAP